MWNDRAAIKALVLATISNDYERLDEIMVEVRRLSDWELTRSNVLDTLAELVNEDLAATFALSSNPPHATQVPFDVGSVEGHWFYVTPAGKQFVQRIDGDAGK